MQEGIRRGLAKCESAMAILAVWATFIIMGITTADAIGRYLFNQSISGVYEITEKYLMIVAVFMAACYGYRRGAYIRVTFFIDRLSRQARIVVDTFAQIFSILFGAFLVIASIKRAIYTIASGTILGTLNYPLWPGYIIVPVGLFFMSLLMLLDLPRMIRGKSSLSKEECHAGEHALDNKDEGD